MAVKKTTTKYVECVKNFDYPKLREIWRKHAKGSFDNKFWAKGKLLEHVVLRAFELEIPDSVTYPFSNREESNKKIIEVEQIDGAIHVDGFHALIECKDFTKNKINVEPLAKLRNQLARRHSAVFGIFFTSTDCTDSAEYLVKFMAPQLIILWYLEDIEYCLLHECFIDCMKYKYKMAVEKCEYGVPYKQYKEGLEKYLNPLF